MNRREFLSFVNPFRAIQKMTTPASPLSEAQRNDLFLRAMALGIDPATLDPDQLLELVGEKDEREKTQERPSPVAEKGT